MTNSKKDFAEKVINTVAGAELSAEHHISKSIKSNIFNDDSIGFVMHSLDCIGAYFWVDDYLNGKIHFLSNQLFTLLGYGEEEIPTTFDGFFSLVHQDDRDNVTDKFDDYISGKAEKYCAEFRLKRKDGGWLWTESLAFVSKELDGKPIEMTGITIDIGRRKELETLLCKTNKELEKKNKLLEHLSYTDKLTGLPNRTKIDVVLDDYIGCKKSKNFSVALIDIDNFKSINDGFGHLVGDNVLERFGKIILATVVNASIVGRWGGEEFIAIFEDLDKDEIILATDNLRNKISQVDFEVVGQITVSIGLSIYSFPEDLRGLIHRADLALYEAKKNGKNRVEFMGK